MSAFWGFSDIRSSVLLRISHGLLVAYSRLLSRLDCQAAQAQGAARGRRRAALLDIIGNIRYLL